MPGPTPPEYLRQMEANGRAGMDAPRVIADRAVRWIVGGDSGVSSRAIWAHMVGQKPSENWGGLAASAPADADDFGRCSRLLALMPAWRSRVGEMAAYGPEWRALAAAWGELEALHAAGDTGRLYNRMRELRSGIR